MKIVVPGHAYELSNYEEPSLYQYIQFIEKQEIQGELVTIADGTTNEEVLDMMINRLITLNKKLPCDETRDAINHLVQANLRLKERTATRLAQGVENTNIAHERIEED